MIIYSSKIETFKFNKKSIVYRKENKMLKYKNIASVGIAVDLHNNYTVLSFANWNKEENNYKTTFYIKRNDVDLLELIEELEVVVFTKSDSKTIRTDIANYITTLLYNNFFDRYITRYEYEQECFDRGNDFFEEERLGNNV